MDKYIKLEDAINIVLDEGLLILNEENICRQLKNLPSINVESNLKNNYFMKKFMEIN